MIQKPYLISKAQFVACHNFTFLQKYDMVDKLVENGTFLLTSPYSAAEVWDTLPIEVQQQLIERKAKFYVINALKLGKELGLGTRINMIMQTAFFLISGILPKEKAIEAIKGMIQKTYGTKGEKVVNMNNAAVDAAVSHIEEVSYPKEVTSTKHRPPIVPKHAPEFVQKVTSEIIAGRGDDLPVSAFPIDGTFMTGTTQYEKQNLATEIPIWDKETCIQCNICAIVCPHAAIRPKGFDKEYIDNAPKDFLYVDAKTKSFKDMYYTLQVAPEDCTGCEICVNACPAFAKDADGNKTETHAI